MFLLCCYRCDKEQFPIPIPNLEIKIYKRKSNKSCVPIYRLYIWKRKKKCKLISSYYTISSNNRFQANQKKKYTFLLTWRPNLMYKFILTAPKIKSMISRLFNFLNLLAHLLIIFYTLYVYYPCWLENDIISNIERTQK